MNNTEFGWEIQGRINPTTQDRVIGVFMITTALISSVLGIHNLFIIGKIEVFRNAFGWFWKARTVGEVVSNVVHLFYSGPVTLFQPIAIPLGLAFSTFCVAFAGSFYACLMHLAISSNRFLAVFAPLRYQSIFTLKNCKWLITGILLPMPFVYSLYFVIPCNAVAYSAHMYEFVFVSCQPKFHRNYSIVGSTFLRVCLSLCSATLVLDFATLCKIIHMKQVQKHKHDNVNFCREIRFFAQASIQNVSMIITSVIMVIANQAYDLDNEVIRITSFNSVTVTHICNSIALIIFNPEVRKHIRSPRIHSMIKPASISCNADSTHHG
ncbi:hypothetical protein L596_027050 [Steinernema carpocapsae]|uniref:7TM GPCR serpentine receptor class x (Srx) domain-containing protein n=1 Tax=Steinernema carpocapsae TaxID=34508 RepID=A0A4U5M362_STECR|nr:hypothetical protein L596_027050 [Steinernema carpocapsae]